MSHIKKIFIWDIDKTYLDTPLEKFWQLLKIPFEHYNKRRNIPGSAELLRYLQHNPAARNEKSFPIYFVSASPKAIHEQLRKKFLSDGILPDQIFLRDQWKILGRRIWQRKNQNNLAYKLSALLEIHLRHNLEKKPIYLFGDNWDMDPLIYIFFRDIALLRFSSHELAYWLIKFGVDKEEANVMGSVYKKLQYRGESSVEKIFIHIARKKDHNYRMLRFSFIAFTRNYLQTAILLWLDSLVSVNAVRDIAYHFTSAYSRPQHLILASTLQLVRKGNITRDQAQNLFNFYMDHSLINLEKKKAAEERLGNIKNEQITEKNDIRSIEADSDLNRKYDSLYHLCAGKLRKS